jgi:hypothetical protein
MSTRSKNRSPPAVNSKRPKNVDAASLRPSKKAKPEQTPPIKVIINASVCTKRVGNTFYYDTRKGESSTTHHCKPFKQQFHCDVVEWSDLLEYVIHATTTLGFKFIFDDAVHRFMVPGECLGSDKRPHYHRLSDFDTETWHSADPEINLNICVVDISVNDMTLEGSSSGVEQKFDIAYGTNVNVYFGGLQYGGRFISDRSHGKAKSVTRLLGSRFLEFPIDREKMYNAADEVFMESTLHSHCKGVDQYKITKQTANFVHSGPIKKGQTLTAMPECVDIPESFDIRSVGLEELAIVIFDLNAEPLSIYYAQGNAGGSNDSIDARIGAIERWAIAACVAFRTTGSRLVSEDIELIGTTDETIKQSAQTFC